MKPWLYLAALPLALDAVAAEPARASDPARYAAATCANCHGTHGTPEGAMPSLAGRDAAALAAELRAFRDGARAATIMHQIAKGYSDAQIDAITAHFARARATTATRGPR